jgi:hypothetical protein
VLEFCKFLFSRCGNMKGEIIMGSLVVHGMGNLPVKYVNSSFKLIIIGGYVFTN